MHIIVLFWGTRITPKTTSCWRGLNPHKIIIIILQIKTPRTFRRTLQRDTGALLKRLVGGGYRPHCGGVLDLGVKRGAVRKKLLFCLFSTINIRICNCIYDRYNFLLCVYTRIKCTISESVLYLFIYRLLVKFPIT